MSLWSSTYRDAAERLGLKFTGDQLFSTCYDLRGQRLGHEVHVRRDMFRKDITYQVGLASPLDLGITLTPKTMLGRVGHGLAELFGARPFMHSGDAALDDTFAFAADEETRAKELVLAAKGALTAWSAVGGPFHLDDVQVMRHRHIYAPFDEDVDIVCAELDGLVSLAVGFERARAKVSRASALEPHAAGFEALARRHGLTETKTPLAVWGTLGAYGFWARATRHGPGAFELEMAAHFASAIPFGGVVRSAKATDAGKRRGGALTGDAAFDDRFVVSSKEALAALQPEVRAPLLRLGAAGEEIFLSERGLGVATPLRAAPYPVESRAELSVAVLRAIEAVLQPHAAYR